MFTFQMSDYAFDTYAKETVKITNGIDKDGIFTPTEAIALRCIGFENNRAITAWTYRRVDVEQLRPVTPNKYALNMPSRRTRYFIGRI